MSIVQGTVAPFVRAIWVAGLLAAVACSKAPPPAPTTLRATLALEYEDRQCVGTNGLDPERIRSALEGGGISVLGVRVPGDIDVPVCEACFPMCSRRFTYEVDVAAGDLDRSKSIVEALRVELPGGRPSIKTEGHGLRLDARPRPEVGVFDLALTNTGTQGAAIPAQLCRQVRWPSVLTIVVDGQFEASISYVDLRYVHDHSNLVIRPGETITESVDIAEPLGSMASGDFGAFRDHLRSRREVAIEFRLGGTSVRSTPARVDAAALEKRAAAWWNVP